MSFLGSNDDSDNSSRTADSSEDLSSDEELSVASIHYPKVIGCVAESKHETIMLDSNIHVTKVVEEAPIPNSELKIKIGSSSCLLGNQVRYNRGHSEARYLTRVLSEYVQYVPTCPEVGIGMGTPRETIRLVGDIEDVRNNNVAVVGGKSGIDYTAKMLEFSHRTVGELRASKIDGFVLKSKSPTCGLRVKVYDEWDRKGSAGEKNMGIFARVLVQQWPELPITEEGRLNSLHLREKFLTSVYAHNRWQQFVSANSIESVLRFHKQHKYLLMSYCNTAVPKLEQMVATFDEDVDDSASSIYSQYYKLFFRSLKDNGTGPQRKADTLMEVLASIRDKLSSDEVMELTETITDLRNELVPMAVPMTLLKHFARKYNCKLVQAQVFNEPVPRSLRIYSHINLS